jgi:hypothetical protein
VAKHGIGSILPFLAAPAALLTGGLLAPELLGGIGAADAGVAAGAGAAAGDAGLASAVADAPLTAGLAGATEAATPLSAGAVDAATAAAGAGGVSGIPSVAADLTAGALPAANTVGGGTLPSATDTSAGLTGTQNVLNDFGGVSSLNTIVSDPAAAAGAGGAQGVANNASLATTLNASDPIAGGTTGVSESATPLDGSGGSLSDIWNFIKKNPGLIASAGGLGLEALRGQSPVPGSGPVNANAAAAAGSAGNLMAQANQNIQAPNTGALPPGTLDAINNAANSAKAQIRSSFASMGIPAGSSMETQALGQVDQQVASQKVEAANKLATLGVSEASAGLGESSLASNDLQALMRAQIQQDANLQNALARFAGAAAGPATATALRPNPATDTTTDTTQLAA